MSSLCQFLDWDSEFFQRRIARVTVNRLDIIAVHEVMTWCELNAIDCLYFLGDLEDKTTIQVAEENGFRLVDIRITLDTRIEEPLKFDSDKLAISIRPSTPDDIAALRAIARVSHCDSRFYYDLHFPQSRCDDLYEMWIEKSCNGYADTVIVAEVDDQIAGYISCQITDPHLAVGQIGLVAVGPEARGMGIGYELVRESLRWFSKHQVQQVIVVTQGRNSKAQRLYQRCGFLTRSVQAWYHRWYSR
jgi:dTDP-4-amino-4,6-dideoxy-D-galactose acyltransferase